MFPFFVAALKVQHDQTIPRYKGHKALREEEVSGCGRSEYDIVVFVLPKHIVRLIFVV